MNAKTTGPEATGPEFTAPEFATVEATGWRRFAASVRADHAAMRSTRERYPTDGTSMGSAGLLSDAIQKVGFQMLIAVRVMRLVQDLHVPLGGPIVSRLIRHVYGAEIHWHATIADGVGFIHGVGIVISHGAVVGPGCILSQNITLGESIDSFTRKVGAPMLGSNVHVGAGAVLLGPISVGNETKIMANAVLDRSVPPRSLVRTPAATIEARAASDSTVDPSPRHDAAVSTVT